MFYPELSPAMRWQLEQHQKMYSMYHSMESGKMALGDQYGEIGMDGMIILWVFGIVVLIIIPAICYHHTTRRKCFLDTKSLCDVVMIPQLKFRLFALAKYSFLKQILRFLGEL